MTESQSIFIEKICRNARRISIFSALTVIVIALFIGLSAQGLAIYISIGVAYFFLLIRSWKYPDGWSTFVAIMILVITSGITTPDDARFIHIFLHYVQNIGIVFFTAFLIISVYKSKVFEWINSN